MKASTSLTPPKLFYFLYYGANACLFPYLSLYYSSQGLSATDIGLLSSLVTLLTLVGSSFWNGLADASHRHSLVLRGCIAGAMVGVALLWFNRSLWVIVPAISLWGFTGASIVPLMDASVLSLLGDQRDRYGKVRLWGSAGWAGVVLLVGAVTERWGLSWMFLGNLALMGGGLLVSFWMTIKPQKVGSDFRAGLTGLLRDRRWLAFLGVIVTSGLALTVINSFLSLYQDSLGFTRTMIGFSIAVSTLSEIPVLFLGSRLLKRFSPRNLLILGLCMYALRLLCYAVAGTPTGIMVGQLLNGPSFGLLTVAGVAYAGKIAPCGLEATAQGLFNTAIYGVGGVLGGVLGGILYDAAGPSGLFYWTAGLSLLGLLFFFGLKEKKEA